MNQIRVRLLLCFVIAAAGVVWLAMWQERLQLLLQMFRPDNYEVARRPPLVPWVSADAFTPLLFESIAPLHSCNLSLSIGSGVPRAPPDDHIPLLAVLVRAGTFYLTRFIESVDCPVDTLLVVQDGQDDTRVFPMLVDLAHNLTGPGRFIKRIRYVTEPGNGGCAEGWNTIIRLYPDEPFWFLLSNDVQFRPGAMWQFYTVLKRDAAADPNVGAMAFEIDFGSWLRRTFAVSAFALTRQGLLRAGLFDENFYPGAYEDDDMVMRLWLAGMKFYAVPGCVARHGVEMGYKTGTVTEDRTGVFSREMGRSTNREYYWLKWGPQSQSVSQENTWMDAEARQSAFRVCVQQRAAAGRWCSPFNSLAPVGTWVFSPLLRGCIRNGPPRGLPNCSALIPRAHDLALGTSWCNSSLVGANCVSCSSANACAVRYD